MTQFAGTDPREAGQSLDRAAIDALTTADGRHIELAGVLNLRDLGNYPVAGGGSVRWRALLRSDALHQLEQGGLA
ncbi:MAG TPA: tyrosine-protein phosphatase, partial [Streptosporangiaceae bacterium]|nr:tyrosine-protein phosphatase [Streptosporangiaceae bacterium]